MADTPVLKLAERRPPIATPWSPRELLVKLIDEIDSGKAKPTCLMVFYMEDTEDNRTRPQTWSANVTRSEAIAFCTLEIQRTIDEWRQ